MAVAVVLPAGCFKSVSHQTTYALKALVQERDGESLQPLPDAVAHAFAADTALWTVASYDDALAGVITPKDHREEMRLLATAAADPREGFEGWLSMSFEATRAMIVVVDTRHKLYGYTQQTFPGNLPAISVELTFRPWKSGTSYKEGNWWMYNDFYVAPTMLDCFFTPRLQRAEEADSLVYTSAADIRAYAFAVDTLDWRIASWDDALAGVITSKTDASRQIATPQFKGHIGASTGEFRMQVTEEQLMVVVVDQANRMYAYSKQTVDLQGDPVSFPDLVFRHWRTEPLYEENGWCVVLPDNDPANQPANRSDNQPANARKR